MKRIFLVTTLLSIFLLSGCNNPTPGPEPTPGTTLPVVFDFDSTSPAEITVNELESKEIKIKFKEDSYKNNADKKIWFIEDKYQEYIIKESESEDGTSYKFKAIKATDEGEPAKISITVTSKDGLATSTVSKTCNITINPHKHDKDSQWVSSDKAHWRHCHSCGQDFDYGDHVTYGFEGDENYHWKECKICKKILNIEKHTPSKEWKHNETHHWHECTKCGAVLNKDKHTINPTNCDCDCGYHDLMFVVNENKVLTRLTEFGKNYTGILQKDNDIQKNAFGSAKIIDENAFEDCQASKIIVPENVTVVHINAFKGVDPAKISYEEEKGTTKLVWETVGNYRIKSDVYKDSVAMINGMFYSSLEDAFNSINQDNTIVKLTKSTLEVKNVIEVKYNVYLESFETATILDASFMVNVGKQLIFDKNVTYKGNVSLISVNDTEKCAHIETECINTGSVCFSDKPSSDVTVKYIDSVQSPNGNLNLDRKAAGSKQKYINESGEEVSVFAYGTLKFSRDLNTIVGLTEFGKTVNELTISDFIEERTGSNGITIGENAFNIDDNRDLKITVEGTEEIIKVKGQFQKGIFKKAIIENGIKSINRFAFNTDFNKEGITTAEQEEIKKQMTGLTSVEIASSVETIEEEAFAQCYSLLNVSVTRGTSEENNKLTDIRSKAFYGCSKLEIVDLTYSTNLTNIGEKAFQLCSQLKELRISNINGWMTTDDKYHFAPHELDSKSFANLVVNAYPDKSFKALHTGDIHDGSIYIYHPNDVDKFGFHNNVIHLSCIQDINDSAIYNNIKDGSVLSITNKYFKCGYDAKDETAEITIHTGHSLYIENQTDYTIKIHDLKVDVGSYAILDDTIKVSNGIFLCQQGSNIGGVAFTYNHTQSSSSKENFVTVQYHGDQGYTTGTAFGFKSRIAYNKSEFGRCTVYGAYSFEVYDNHVIFFAGWLHEMKQLSSLGRICKDIKIDFAVDNRLYANIGIDSNFSSHNNLLETVEIGKKVRYITYDPGFPHENSGSFNDCFNLKSVSFAKDSEVKTMDKYSFSNCVNLSNFDVSNCSELIELREGCFQNNHAKFSFLLPDSNRAFQEIEKSAFRACGLQSFHIPLGIRNNWKAGSTKISPERLADDANVAKLLTNDYVGKNWKRSN